jgi:DNA-binding GntR family transcriptional regulator
MNRSFLPSLDHDTLAFKAYASLQEAILQGKIKPGDRLIEDELSAAFGISRAPIREALRLMEKDGLVRIIRRKGALVSRFSMEDILESYEILGVLEGLAARLFCQKAEEQEISDLQKICRGMEAQVSNSNFSEYRRLNREFHAAFIRGSRSRKIKELHEQIQKQIDWFQRVTLSHKGRPRVSLHEHKAILRAFQLRNGKEAEDEVRKHVMRASSYLKKESDGGR